MQKTSIELWNGEGNINPRSQYFSYLIYSSTWWDLTYNHITLKSWSLWVISDPNDARVECKTCFSLMELINSIIHLKRGIKWVWKFSWIEKN
jgi:hypothetical protein